MNRFHIMIGCNLNAFFSAFVNHHYFSIVIDNKFVPKSKIKTKIKTLYSWKIKKTQIINFVHNVILLFDLFQWWVHLYRWRCYNRLTLCPVDGWIVWRHEMIICDKRNRENDRDKKPHAWRTHRLVTHGDRRRRTLCHGTCIISVSVTITRCPCLSGRR